jgi:hypothetical protein
LSDGRRGKEGSPREGEGRWTYQDIILAELGKRHSDNTEFLWLLIP